MFLSKRETEKKAKKEEKRRKVTTSFCWEMELSGICYLTVWLEKPESSKNLFSRSRDRDLRILS